METEQAVMTAISVREYDRGRKAEMETIRRIVDAGRMSASAMNKQPWFFIVINEAGKLKEVADLTQTGKHIAGASFAVAVVTDPSNRYHEIDAARAVQNMVIEAWDLGLGNSWVGNMDREKIKQVLKVPPNLHLLTVLPFGYPTRKYKGRKSRKPFSETVFLGAYGSPFP
ncbi:MAG TPA: nitroreductase family protein [Nitrososphaerales archaeon]|nr:nitroreductase family protein [Nitrososphaerales archaeon]